MLARGFLILARQRHTLFLPRQRRVCLSPVGRPRLVGNQPEGHEKKKLLTHCAHQVPDRKPSFSSAINSFFLLCIFHFLRALLISTGLSQVSPYQHSHLSHRPGVVIHTNSILSGQPFFSYLLGFTIERAYYFSRIFFPVMSHNFIHSSVAF